MLLHQGWHPRAAQAIHAPTASLHLAQTIQPRVPASGLQPPCIWRRQSSLAPLHGQRQTHGLLRCLPLAFVGVHIEHFSDGPSALL